MANVEIKEICDFEDIDETCELLAMFIKKNNRDDGFEIWTYDYICELCNLNSSDIYLLTVDGKIKGVAKVDLFDSYVYLSDIIIAIDSRKKGYGNMLIDYALENNGVDEIDLNVSCDNKKAIIFYLHIDFMIKGFISQYYGDSDCIYMVKKVKVGDD